MSIKKATPPDVIEQLAQASLNQLPRFAHKKLAAFLATRKKPLRLADCLPVWNLGLDPLVREPTLSAAKQIAWRFFVLSGDKAIAATEIALSPDGGQPHWSHLSYDPRIRTNLDAVRRTRSNPRYRRGSYAMRLLRIPALDLNALLWLKPLNKGKDVVIPMVSIALLRPGWPYSVETLFTRVNSRAVRRLATSTRPPKISRSASDSRERLAPTTTKRASRRS
jgi:hypothetical protein